MLERGDFPEEEGALCSKCPLAQSILTFPEEGAHYRGIVLLGEAPGRDEASIGTPFVGKSGKLLMQALKDAGLSRDECHITNSVLHWPPGNLKPQAKALNACRPRLYRELKECNPRVIVALGNSAIAQVVAGKRSISSVQGTAQAVNPAIGLAPDCLVVPAWHPAFVLRQRSLYADLVRSLIRAKDHLDHPNAQGLGSFGLTSRIRARWVNSDESARDFLAAYPDDPRRFAGIDIETSGLNPYREDAKIYTVAFSFEEGVESGWVFDLLHYPAGFSVMKEALGRRTKQVWHNGMFDIGYLRAVGIGEARLDLDTLLTHFAMDEGGGGNRLEHLADQEFGSGPYKSIVNWDWSKPESIDWERLLRYNAADAFYTLHLGVRFFDRIRTDRDAMRVAILIHQGADPLMAMQQTGVFIDLPNVRVKMDEAASQEKTILHELEELGVSINLNSPAQLSRLIYDDWALLDPEDGKKSVDKEHLSLISDDPRIQRILDYRKIYKIRTTFLEKLERFTDRNGRLHTIYKPQGTVSGRLSSGDSKAGLINVQQIAARDSRFPVRDLFIPDPGYTWVEADLSQAELRVMAEHSGDIYLRSEIEKGTDLHTLTAAVMLQKSPENVTKSDRQTGKTLNFALTYGMGAEHLARSLGVSLEEAIGMRDAYLSRVPGLLAWRRRMERQILQERFVETVTGRKRRFLYVDTRDPDAVRKGINSIIQGEASDITLISLIEFFDIMQKERLPSRLLLTVHDSIDIEVRADEAKEVATLLKRTMEYTPRKLGFTVPFVADLKIGPSWGELKEVTS